MPSVVTRVSVTLESPLQYGHCTRQAYPTYTCRAVDVTPPSKKRRRPAPVSDPTELVVMDEHALLPGTPVGEYRIEYKIGEGGMGVVYAAVHPRLGAKAAVKILRRELCADQLHIQRFVDEA